MPHISALPRLSRNIYVFGKFGANWRRSALFRNLLLQTFKDRFELVHFNHEGLFLLAHWLRRELGQAVCTTQHVRTILPSNFFSRWQYRSIAASNDAVVYISHMERENVRELVGWTPPGPVIHNIVSQPCEWQGDPELIDDKRFKVASVSNYSWIRGGDRLIDVAVAIKAQGRRDVLFVVAGDHSIKGNPPGDLRKIARQGGTLKDYAANRGVLDMFTFLGHVGDPERILASCDLLARPSRGNDPWGREVLEAMAFGLPVIATGSYDRFVENGQTGVLQAKFDAVAMANAILDLAGNRVRCQDFGRRARARVAELCDGELRAAELANLWRSIGR